MHKEYNNQAPKFSIIIPIHNQEGFVTKQIESILSNTLGHYEIITILDNCTDNSKEHLLDRIEIGPIPENLSSITVFENQAGMFETSADNLGFTKARGEILIEIQADMEILTTGYNLNLAYPLKIYSDLIAVSGRCCHSVNRGPLAIAKEKIAKLGYLDEFHYCLGEDDHVLFLRAWKEKNWRTGFMPIEFHSPLDRGSTRRPRTLASEFSLRQRKKRQAEGYFSVNQKTATYPSSEIRRPSNTEKILALQSLMNPGVKQSQ